ncbi:MAG: toprim domain-containing protein [Nitrosomonas ureae]
MKNPHRQDAGLGVADNSSYFTTSKPLTHESIDQFRQAMQAAGIHYSGEIVADGRLHRFHIEGHKRGSLNGAYLLHLDGCPAGWFMDYKTGLSRTWRSSGRSQVSYALVQQIKEAKQQREAETRQKQSAAASKAVSIWSKSKPITRKENHQYLVNKQIQQHGTRLYRDALVIPIHNESDQLVNLQFISPEGDKRFLSGGRKRGCFHVIGDVSEKILICEGFATGASLYEDCGQRVVIAFDAGNLLPVAKNIRELSPDSEIIICGDNDFSGMGQAAAREAALSIGGKILIPPVPGQDWNDYLTGGKHA